MKLSSRVVPLCIAFSCAAVSLNAQQYHVVGYYPMWVRSTLPASAVKFEHLTHINHAFAWPTADGNILAYDAVADTVIINATHRAGRKILVSLGGAAESGGFSAMAADSTARQAFVGNLVSYLKNNGYDGADLDWEGPQSDADKSNEVTLVKEIRQAFQATDSTWLLTMAVGVTDWSGRWHDFGSLIKYVDWFNAMTYDYHGSWSSHAGHNAPLYLGSDPINDYSVDQSFLYLTGTRSIPKEKLVLGLPFYGKSFGTSTLYTSYAGEQDLAFRDVMNAVRSGSWSYNWDNASKVPYYTSVSPPRLISFDDSASIAIKCQYARSKGVSGVMIWELSQDVIGREQPLMDVVGAQMIATTGVPESQSDLRSTGFALFDNYPNPFSARGGSTFGGNPSTTIRFAIPVSANVSIRIFDMLGREVATLLNEYRNAGTGNVRFDASNYDITSGVYFYRIQAGAFTQTKKLILVK